MLQMEEDEYAVTESLTPLDVASKIAEPILSLVALAVLYFFGLDWFLDPIVSFFSQFDWFTAGVALAERLFSVFEWLDSLNGTGGPSLPFDASVLDVIFTLGELVLGIAVIENALNASIVAIRSEGVTMRDVSVPWSSIRHVVIVQPQSAASESDQVEVGLRLDPDASLPEDLSSLDIDSSTNISSDLHTSLDGHPLDRERLVAAVHDCAPTNVSVIELQGDTERERKPQNSSSRAVRTNEPPPW